MKHGVLMAGKNIIYALLAAILLMSCGDPYQKSMGKRNEIARKGEVDIVVGVVWPRSQSHLLFLQGVDLAVREINKKGGALGRKLRTIVFDDIENQGDQFDAWEIAGNSEIVAVVGHFHSGSAITASITYEYNGILFLATMATNPHLLDHGFRFVFRTIPNDRHYGEQLVRYAHGKGFREILIIDNNTTYGKGLADIFHERATDQGLNIVAHKGYFQWQDNFRPLIAQVAQLKFDAVFLGGELPHAAIFMEQFHQMGLTAPFMGGDALDSPDLITMAGSAAEGTVVPTPFNSRSSDPVFLSFRRSFHAKYKRGPDTLASQAYDAIRLLAFAVEKSGTARPFVVASTLRHVRNWKGVLGNYSFEPNGELSDRLVLFKKVHHGRFVYIGE